jgi:hypothetical protein
MLGQLTGQHKAHRCLDLAGRDGVALVVAGQTTSLRGDALEDVVNKGVHDDHGLLGHSGIGVHLLQHLVDVRCILEKRVSNKNRRYLQNAYVVGVRLSATLSLLTIRLGGGLASLAWCLSSCLCFNHDFCNKNTMRTSTQR